MEQAPIALFLKSVIDSILLFLFSASSGDLLSSVDRWPLWKNVTIIARGASRSLYTTVPAALWNLLI